MNFDKTPFFHHRDPLGSIGVTRPSQWSENAYRLFTHPSRRVAKDARCPRCDTCAIAKGSPLTYRQTARIEVGPKTRLGRTSLQEPTQSSLTMRTRGARSTIPHAPTRAFENWPIAIGYGEELTA
jgi:hypothetical protein